MKGKFECWTPNHFVLLVKPSSEIPVRYVNACLMKFKKCTISGNHLPMSNPCILSIYVMKKINPSTEYAEYTSCYR